MKPAVEKQLLRRLQIIGGQMEGLKKMIKADKYCIDIIIQSLAVKEALSSVENALLENHLSSCAANQMKAGKIKKAVAEILKVYRLSKKR